MNIKKIIQNEEIDGANISTKRKCFINCVEPKIIGIENLVNLIKDLGIEILIKFFLYCFYF